MYSQSLVFSLQFTVYVSHEFTKFEINMTGEFSYFRKTILFKKTAIKSYSVRGFKISKELKRIGEDVNNFVKKKTYVKYYFE